MVNKYINGGIVKEITLYLKNENDLSDALNKLGEFINLDLYDMKRYDNALYFELDDNYIKKYLADFFREISDLKIIDRLDYDKKIIEGAFDIIIHTEVSPELNKDNYYLAPKLQYYYLDNS